MDGARKRIIGIMAMGGESPRQKRAATSERPGESDDRNVGGNVGDAKWGRLLGGNRNGLPSRLELRTYYRGIGPMPRENFRNSEGDSGHNTSAFDGRSLRCGLGVKSNYAIKTSNEPTVNDILACHFGTGVRPK